jgi:uncharacterized membrane protein
VLSKVISRLFDLALLVLSVLGLVLQNVLYVELWIVGAIIYIATRARRVAHAVRDPKTLPSTSVLIGGWFGQLFTTLASVLGVGWGLQIVLTTGTDLDYLTKILGVPVVLLAWAILHFGYAERYASAYYGSLPTKQFEFPETEQPNFADFAYFAFTVGTTFAVSDVETRTTAARARVLSHSVLSFLYNTATLGIAIGVISGGK